MAKSITAFLLCTLIVFQIKAQKQKNISSFLSDMGIKDFKINSKLRNLKSNKNLKGKLTFVDKIDDESDYLYKESHLNFKSTTTLSDATFEFTNDSLKRVVFEKIGDLSDGVFEQVYNELTSKYGQPVSLPVKNMLYRRYEWHYKDLELILKPLKISFLVIYGKEPGIKHQWIYADRKGSGNNTMQISLPYWEKLIYSNLTINSFEKCLPKWETLGVKNHLEYGLNFKTKQADIPEFTLVYKLNNYDIKITADTTSKKISNYTFYNIKDQNSVNSIKNDLIKSHYKLTQKVEIAKASFYFNDTKKVSIMLIEDDTETSFEISK